jgi:hypothetical protein
MDALVRPQVVGVLELGVEVAGAVDVVVDDGTVVAAAVVTGAVLAVVGC